MSVGEVMKKYIRKGRDTMAYIHYINGNQYGVKVISYNHYEVLKNGHLEESFDTFEDAQHFIDDLSSN